MVRTRKAALVLAVLGAMLTVPAVAAADGDGLEPGGMTDFDERVTVNVVFVGFDEGDAPWKAVQRQLPSGGEPIVRSRAFYGIDEPLGLDYDYDYRPYYTSRSWEDGFFSYLSSIAVAKPLTEWQQAYNDQAGVLDVTSNRWIDAPTVEKRLIDTAPQGVDTRKPTIFFINWYGRSDFKFHVYSKVGEPDPDTGHDFGLLERRPQDRRLGRHHARRRGDRPRPPRRAPRVVLRPVRRPGGVGRQLRHHQRRPRRRRRRRLPHPGLVGVRAATARESALPGDLGKVIRYVGLDLLFTSSPLYPPYFTADRLPDRVDLDVNTVEGLPGVDASRQFIKRDLFIEEERELPTGFAAQRRLPGPAVLRRLPALLRGRVPGCGRPVPVLPEARGLPAGREPVPGRRPQPAAASSSATPTTRRG